MKYKADWPEARERLTALWEGRPLDRPCIAVTAPSGKGVAGPPPPTNAAQRWMDPEWVVADALASLQNTWWGGETIPSYLLMGGWVVSLGGTPCFHENTIWFDTFPVDFNAPSPFVHDPDGPWPKKFEQVYVAAAQAAGRNDFLIGQPCILPANDLLSMHMGTEAFLMALMDEPRWMKHAILQGARELVRARNHLGDLIRDQHEFWYGNPGWMPFWAPRPYTSTQSDVSCMLSPDAFNEFIVPELNIYTEASGALWYHLDGQDARQHLPALLSMPTLRVVQYVPTPAEPPNGVGQLDLYREIQAAGRIVHVQVAADQIEPLIKALDPGLLVLQTWCGTIEEGQELLRASKRWMHARSG